MLLSGYRKEIFLPKCNPEFQSIHCIAHLNEDITEVLPYLNAALGGDDYTREPPSVTFHYQGKLLTVHPREIAVNALEDETEADRILEWLRREINDTWEHREEIEPKFEGRAKPQVIEILKLLPKSNCRECGLPTCMVFAVQVAAGGRDPQECKQISHDSRISLEKYLQKFPAD